MKKIVYSFLFLCLFGEIGFASIAEIPERGDYLFADLSGTLSETEKEVLKKDIEKFNTETIADLAVIFLPSTGTEDAMNYAKRVESKWEIGKNKKNKGFVIVVETEKKKWTVLKSYGLEANLQDHILKEIEKETFGKTEDSFFLRTRNFIEDLYKIMKKDPEIREKYIDVIEGIDKTRIKKETTEIISYAILGGVLIIFIGVFLTKKKKKL